MALSAGLATSTSAAICLASTTRPAPAACAAFTVPAALRPVSLAVFATRPVAAFTVSVAFSAGSVAAPAFFRATLFAATSSSSPSGPDGRAADPLDLTRAGREVSGRVPSGDERTNVTLKTALDVAGKVTKQPPFWVAFAGVLALQGGGRRRAAGRGAAGYGLAVVVANLVLKPLVGRDRPDEAGWRGFPPLTSSFPSGHAAADTAFAVAAARSLPRLSLPLTALTTASHWSLVRTHSHFVTDILAGDLVGLGVALAMERVWPLPARDDRDPTAATA